MNWLLVLEIAQLIVAVLLIILISIQGKGAGLSATFGGGAAYSTRRGAEKVVFRSTIVLTTLFAALSLVGIFL